MQAIANGHSFDDYFVDDSSNYKDARRMVNGCDHAQDIADSRDATCEGIVEGGGQLGYFTIGAIRVSRILYCASIIGGLGSWPVAGSRKNSLRGALMASK